MEYTVKALADLAGVTPRTLRWYDRIGLLKPLRTTEAGYRLYGPAHTKVEAASAAKVCSCISVKKMWLVFCKC